MPHDMLSCRPESGRRVLRHRANVNGLQAHRERSDVNGCLVRLSGGAECEHRGDAHQQHDKRTHAADLHYASSKLCGCGL